MTPEHSIGKQHWTTACSRIEAWILAKPVSTSASEISSQAGEGVFDDEILVDTPKQHEVQVLVVQAQNGANMATSSTPTAAGTTITADSTAARTAAFQVAGPSTKEPIVVQLGQDTPSVIQGARLEQRLVSQTYFSGQQYTAAQPYTAVSQPYTTAAQPQVAAAQPYFAPYNNTPAMSARPTEPMGYFGQGGQLLLLTEEQLLQHQQLFREKQEFDAWRASRAQARTQPQPEMTSEGPISAEVNVDVHVDSERSASVARARPRDQSTKKSKVQRAESESASTSHRSPSSKRTYPRGTCTVTRLSQASPRKAEHTVSPAQDLEGFKADMTSMLSEMLQASFQKFASQFNTNSGGQTMDSKEDTVPKEKCSEATIEVAYDNDNDKNDNSPQRGLDDQSEGEIIEGEGDPADSGLPTLEQLKNV